VWRSNTTKMWEKQLSNGRRMGGVCILILALSTESVVTFIITCYLKKASKTNFLFVFIKFEYQTSPFGNQSYLAREEVTSS
jgi:hypothetical protein